MLAVSKVRDFLLFYGGLLIKDQQPVFKHFKQILKLQFLKVAQNPLFDFFFYKSNHNEVDKSHLAE